MKVGDKVQYCGYDTLGATGEIIREKEKTLYYSKWEREGDDRYCMCYLVRYTMPNGKTVDNVARPEDLKLLKSEEDIVYLKKNLFKSLKVPKDYLNENFTRCFYCSSVFSDNEFDDDYAICGKCRDEENEE